MKYKKTLLNLAITHTHKTIGFLDLETSGLNKSKDTILVIGLLILQNNSAYVHQWVLEDPKDEPILITTLLDKLKNCHQLFTYGGSSFDLSFIETKAIHYHIDLSFIKNIPSIDFKTLKAFKHIFNLSRMNRSTIEAIIRYTRKSTLSGKELGKIGTLFLKQPRSSYSELLCLHNMDELEGLLYFWFLYEMTVSLRTKIPKILNDLSSTLLFTYPLTHTFDHTFSFSIGYYQLSYLANHTYFTMTIQSVYASLTSNLPHKDYYIVNGTPLHKSLAQFIPISQRVKATAQNAIITKEDYFVPLSATISSWYDVNHHFYECYDHIVTDNYTVLLSDLKKIITHGLSY